jgi:quercetin dioxygenase-like cupin family protein
VGYSPPMPRLIEQPTRVAAVGTKPKAIDEYFGRVNSGDQNLSVAVMHSPPGWQEPGQRPSFDEYTLVLEGALVVEHETGTLTVRAGQAVHTAKGEWVRYGTPEGARYVAICLPAFSPETVHRDA